MPLSWRNYLADGTVAVLIEFTGQAMQGQREDQQGNDDGEDPLPCRGGGSGGGSVAGVIGARVRQEASAVSTRAWRIVRLSPPFDQQCRACRSCAKAPLHPPLTGLRTMGNSITRRSHAHMKCYDVGPRMSEMTVQQGRLPLRPDSGRHQPGHYRQTRQVLAEIDKLLARKLASDRQHVLRAEVFLAPTSPTSTKNKAWDERVTRRDPGPRKPSRKSLLVTTPSGRSRSRTAAKRNRGMGRSSRQ